MWWCARAVWYMRWEMSLRTLGSNHCERRGEERSYWKEISGHKRSHESVWSVFSRHTFLFNGYDCRNDRHTALGRHIGDHLKAVKVKMAHLSGLQVRMNPGDKFIAESASVSCVPASTWQSATHIYMSPPGTELFFCQVIYTELLHTH